ncbi:unnamed protein product, partial [Dicrocoelium dendriticum]
MRHAHSNCRNLSFATLDISKAFDLVSHDSLLRAAESFGAPTHLLNHLRSYYHTATSRIDDCDFHPNRGVRQGDPLSPLLFIMTLDEVLKSTTHFGWQSPGGTIDYLAYADDVILLAQDRANLETRVECLASSLELVRLKLNQLKSRV